MKVLVLLLLCVVVGSYARPKLRGSMASKEWKMFKAKHHKVYKSAAEEVMRFKIYLQNKRAILNHNNKQRRSMSTFSVQMNKFGDMLRSEYKALLGRRKRKHRRRTGGYYENSGATLPENLDLRTLNLVNPPKNQGYVCGSCWSFSTTGSIEGQVAKRTGRLLELSQQNMIDCAKLNGGCNGGYEYIAFEYARDYGVQLASSYPYEEKVGRCRADENEYRVYISGYKPIRSANETDLMDALYNVGPISVGIDSSSDMFKFYSSGVFAPDPTKCQASNIDHAVLAVGYGTDESGEDYWLIKNSWGPEWGEKGYVRVLRDGTNFCGIASDPVFPTL